MPCAHVLIGVVVDAIGMRNRRLRSATAVKYFRGKAVRSSSRAEIFRAFANGLGAHVRARYEATTSKRLPQNFNADAMMDNAVEAWEFRRRAGLPAAMIELAVRLAAGAQLVCGSKARALECLGELETSLLAARTGGRRWTQEQLAREVGVAPRQVRRWATAAQSARPAQHKAIARAFAAETSLARSPTAMADLERRVARWFEARSLRRELVKRAGNATATTMIGALATLLRTLLSHDFMHEGEVITFGGDGALFCVLAYGTGSMSGGLAVEVVERHAKRSWRLAAANLLAPERARQAAFDRNAPLPSRNSFWDNPELLAGCRALPNYPKLVAGFATIAMQQKKRKAAWRLAREAAQLGEMMPLHELERTRRRRIRPSRRRKQ